MNKTNFIILAVAIVFGSIILGVSGVNAALPEYYTSDGYNYTMNDLLLYYDFSIIKVIDLNNLDITSYHIVVNYRLNTTRSVLEIEQILNNNPDIRDSFPELNILYPVVITSLNETHTHGHSHYTIVSVPEVDNPEVPEFGVLTALIGLIGVIGVYTYSKKG